MLLLLLCLPLFSLGQKKAYQIYDGEGVAAEYESLFKAAKKADVILFGELHDNPIIHWLQLELTKELYAEDERLVLGAEMMEADNQTVIDEYLAGWISEKKLIAEAKVWPNFKTDYLPLMAFAKENDLNFVATNVPRRYASIVYRHGPDTLTHLSEEALSHMTPLPYAIDTSHIGYQEMLNMAMGHRGDNLPKSQALKDATMAHFILQNLGKKETFIHYNGTFHSKNYEGIYWYLKESKPKLKVLTIASHEQEEIDSLSEDQLQLADYIIVTPASMCKTH
jgi:uncharacterized iron-regulated protein